MDQFILIVGIAVITWCIAACVSFFISLKFSSRILTLIQREWESFDDDHQYTDRKPYGQYRYTNDSDHLHGDR